MDSVISDLALDLGLFALDNELESGRECPQRIRRETKKAALIGGARPFSRPSVVGVPASDKP